MAGSPTLLLGCFFPRSIELEGVGTFLHGLAEGFRDCGCQVTLLRPAGEYAPIDGVASHTYAGRGIMGLWGYRAALARLTAGLDAAFLVENNPNFSFTHDWSRAARTFCYFLTPYQPAQSAGRMGGRQGVLHALAKSPFWGRLQKWGGRRVIVPTNYQAEQLRPFGPRQLEVLGGSSLSARLLIADRAAARAKLGWDAAPVVGYLGHFSPAKGVDQLLLAFEQAPAPAVLALAHSGKGRIGAEARAAADRLRQAGRLRELGVVDALTFLAACDVVALPYPTSSIFHPPQVMLESFAAGTAVITTDVGGLAEIHQAGQTGLLIPPRDVPALTRALAELLQSELATDHAMGQAARRHFEQRLCREVFIRQLVRLLA